jgi:putative ABC transport system ATP-binding protein
MIATRSLAFAYVGGARLSFADVCLPQGGVLWLAGPSGSGKSTWLALAAGLMAPIDGELEVAGRVLSGSGAKSKPGDMDRWRAAAIGFLPQRLHLSPSLSVRHNLAMAQWAAGQPEDAAQARAVLARLGVDELIDRLPSALSGGQAQRVALARALLLKPQVILADEPTASLDDATAEVAGRLLIDSARHAGASLVIASHDARLAQLLAEAAPGFQSLRLAA